MVMSRPATLGSSCRTSRPATARIGCEHAQRAGRFRLPHQAGQLVGEARVARKLHRQHRVQGLPTRFAAWLLLNALELLARIGAGAELLLTAWYNRLTAGSAASATSSAVRSAGSFR